MLGMRLALLLGILICPLTASTAQQPEKGLSFEVASIRPGAAPDAEMIPIRMKVERSRIHYVNASLRDCIRVAYGVKDFQILGPAWLSSRFNIEARFPEDATEDQVPEMLQSLLKERFHLQIHRETREHAVYALVLAKHGPNLKPTQLKATDLPDSPTRRPGTPVYGDLQLLGSTAGMHITGPAIDMRTLSETLSVFTPEPVVDQTDLKGRYDIDLTFMPEGRLRMHGGPGTQGRGLDGADNASEAHGSVFEAVQELGLKLESRRAPLPLLVVDRLEKTPTEN